MNEVGTVLKNRILIPEVPVKMERLPLQHKIFKNLALNKKHGSCYLDQNHLHSMESLRKLHFLGQGHPDISSSHTMRIFPFVKE